MLKRPQQSNNSEELVPVGDLVAWSIRKLKVRPYDGMWCFNPSIHFDGETWRCSIRCADYAMPGGVQIRGAYADKFGVQSRNVMVHIDPERLSVLDGEIFPMLDRDDLPRNKAGNRGFEDLRLFHTDSGGLQAIACAAHLDRPGAGMFPPEQVILTLADDYSIIEAHPIRGDTWGGPQKNWVPFDGAVESRFLYSIDRGMVFSPDGPIEDPEPEPPEPAEMEDTAVIESMARARGLQVQPMRVSLPPGGAEFRSVKRIQAIETKRLGRRDYAGLRGGSQLVCIAENTWLGIGHEMRLERGRKLYWHRFYATDSDGKLIGKSRAFKLVTEGIEFAAGLVVDEDRVVISLGVDDAECRIGETRLDDVMAILEDPSVFAKARATTAKPLPPSPRRSFTTSGSGTAVIPRR